MEQNKQSMTNPDQQSEFAVISVPDHLREQVLDHLAELAKGDVDVSGHMMGGISSHSLSDVVDKSVSGTGCKVWDSRGSMDFNCVDHD